MLHVNENYSKIQASYLFTEIAHRVAAHQSANPDAKIIRLGIGDVTEPLCDAVVKAMHKAVDDEATRENFHGYGPEQGYAFLREKVAKFDFQDRGIDIAADEIFISDGAKCDCGNIQELFGPDVKIAVGDPVYPVYVDTNVMAGRTGANGGGRYEGLVYLTCDASNGFVPAVSCAFISSIMTIAFLISIPTSERNPRSAMNPNGWSNPRSPATTPTRMNGTVMNITTACLTELKSMITMITITASIGGIFDLSPAFALDELSYSPPQSHE